MNDDKYFNHVFKYCLSEQVLTLSNIFNFIYLSLFSAIARSVRMATVQVSAT